MGKGMTVTKARQIRKDLCKDTASVMISPIDADIAYQVLRYSPSLQL